MVQNWTYTMWTTSGLKYHKVSWISSHVTMFVAMLKFAPEAFHSELKEIMLKTQWQYRNIWVSEITIMKLYNDDMEAKLYKIIYTNIILQRSNHNRNMCYTLKHG